MVNELLMLLSLGTPDYTGRAAAEAALVLHTKPTTQECCGLCKNGKIRHGDGHTTDCPCPDDCPCKTKGAVIHPPAVIHPLSALKTCEKCIQPKK